MEDRGYASPRVKKRGGRELLVTGDAAVEREELEGCSKSIEKGSGRKERECSQQLRQQTTIKLEVQRA